MVNSAGYKSAAIVHYAIQAKILCSINLNYPGFKIMFITNINDDISYTVFYQNF